MNRRSFLLMTTAGIATVPSLSLAQAPKQKLGVALLGLGSYSTGVLAPALQLTQHCELKGVISGSPDKIARWQNRYGLAKQNTYSYDTMHRVADNDEIDVIYVVTPTSTHMDFVIKAAQAGKHVWCEKPMAMTVAECQKMIDVCNKSDVKLSIGYRMQHEPNTRAFAAFNQRSPFGAMSSLSSFAGYSGGPGPKDYWRMQRKMGGGALYDMGVYAINGARFLSGQEPVAVKARSEMPSGFDEVDASTYFTLKFANGLEADCGTSVVTSFNYIKVNCEKGWYQLKPMQSYSGVRGETSSGVNVPAFEGNQQARQMDDDAQAIILDQAPLVPGIEGLKDIRVVEGALRSARTTQDFVELV
jgi:glucose-fructose oxidoreductase